MNPVFHKLGLTTPIFGFSHCRDVVAAVSKAGGVGVYGAGLHSDEQIAQDLRWIEQQLGDAPYGVDVMLPSKYVGSDQGGLSPEEAAAAIPAEIGPFLDDMMVRYGVPALPDNAEAAHYEVQRYTTKQAQGVLDLVFSAFKPKLIVSALGSPPPSLVALAHERGMLVGALAGRVKHALAHVAAGVDIIIAQSYEAGGHTGDIGGMVLTPQIVDAVAPVPVLAAGGIADGRQMAAALALGAQGVWCGSVWLTTAESETLPLTKGKLIAAGAEDTVRSRALTGKPSRMLNTAWVQEWARPNTPDPLPTPLHSLAIDPYIARIQSAASGDIPADRGPGALANSPVGQVVALMVAETSCREVMRTMTEGCVEAVARAQALLENAG